MIWKYCFYIFLFICLSFSAKSQNNYIIKGIVKDSLSQTPLTSVTVTVIGEYYASLTNSKGFFQLPCKKKNVQVIFSCIGYSSKEIPVNALENKNLEVFLLPSSIKLEEVVTNVKREKYIKKGNPAVELIKKVIEHKNDNRPDNHDYYQYEEYSRKSVALNNFNENVKIKGYEFLHNYVDTPKIGNNPILWLSVKEKVSDIYYRKSPKAEKEVIKGIRRVGIDESFNQEGVDNVLNEVFTGIDIFGNDITFLMNRFVSPLSNIATSFYKFYIVDTVSIDNKPFIDLEFVPFNTRDFGFMGHLFISADSSYSVKRVQMSIPHDINLNYVSDLYIEQEFNQHQNGTWILSKETMAVDFVLLRSLQGFYAEINKHFSGYIFDEPRKEAYQLATKTSVSPLADQYPEVLWQEWRRKGIREKEVAVTKMMDELHQKKSFNVAGVLLDVFSTGYIPTGKDTCNKVEIGPFTSFISHNDVEGWRFRTGFRTTVNANKHWYLAGYGAYGIADKKFKYYGDLRYSFIEREIYIDEFPQNNIGISYKYDLEVPGQRTLNALRDNFFLSFNRDDATKMSYIKQFSLFYQKEFENDFSYDLRAVYRNDTPTGSLQYLKQTSDGIVSINNMTTSEFNLLLKYSPGQKFYQQTGRRLKVSLDAPTFTLTQTVGIKNFMGSDYNLQSTEISADKRFWLSAFGNINATLRAGKVWNTAPFPLLFNPSTNTSYFIEPESYSMMNTLEFINDQYVSLFLTYHANGWIFNRIPLIKHLRMREVVSFRGLWGSLSDKNNPANNSDVFLFPMDENGNPTSFKMTNTPYVEMSFGIENILNIIRLDYILRMTYLGNPDISKHGWQLGFTFKF